MELLLKNKYFLMTTKSIIYILIGMIIYQIIKGVIKKIIKIMANISVIVPV